MERNITRRQFIAAVLSAGLLTPARTGAGQPIVSTRRLIALVDGFAPAVKALTARTMPAEWKLLHACLYYALAGQYLLGRCGIPTRLKGGAVVYFPDSPLHHRIKPHVWLDTGTHYIDCSALPRWGYIVGIPLHRVALDPAAVIPRMTQVLILEERDDPQFLDYIAEHHARFGRAPWGEAANDE